MNNTQAAATKKKKSRSLDTQKSRMGWVFVAPFLIGFFLIYLPMIVESIKFSFMKMDARTMEFVGFENYSYALFTDANYTQTLISSIKDLVFSVPAIVIFSLFMAVLLNQKMRGRAIFRAIFFIPVIVSTGIIESIDLQNTLAANMEQLNGAEDGFEGGSSGQQIISALDVNRLFAGMRVGAGLVGYVTNLVNNVYGIINKSGVQMLIFLAGLQSISPAIYESCYIDGASSWETFWKITFPMISPMILVNAIYTVIDSFTSQSNQVMKYISNVYGQANGWTRSTAMAWMYFLIVVIMLAIVAAILSAYVFYQRKDT
ncbi:MAG: sugar ABC transporter permease [Clostridiales bacterium]|nr:sugar ABC transporter permease [Candidatus Coliplasma equi]